ncbi:MAG: class I SAM-dependent RNA methyltransferase [Deltaproteobacteria bacterium]|nr:class I SAM-dependent RNA methyltransferase [Deltaproteobacteria bacterium]
MNELVIEAISTAGEGIGRLANGQVVFVPGGVPGDRLRVRLTGRRHRVQLAELLEVIDPSALRIRSRCAVDPCGGCALRMVAAEGLGDLKRRRVVDALRRIGGLDVEATLAAPLRMGDGWRYRHRVRLHAAHSGRRWDLGYYAAKSHALVPIEACPVLWRELEQAATSIATALAPLPRAVGLGTVELAYSRRDNRSAAVLTVSGDPQPLTSTLKWLEDAGLSGAVVVSPERRFQHGNVELRYDHGRVDEYSLRFEPDLFTQAWPEMNDRLVAAVMAAVKPKAGLRVLEYHSGIGNFTLPMALAGAEVTAVERNRRAAILCRRNLRGAGATAEVVALSDADASDRLPAAEVVLLDPPRTGARAVAEALAARGPSVVVYVSCDSATLARDAKILTGGGYQLNQVAAFDMFPQTPHVETLCVFTRLGVVSP